MSIPKDSFNSQPPILSRGIEPSVKKEEGVKIKELTSEEEMQKTLFAIVSNGETFIEKSNQMMKLLKEAAPKELDELRAFLVKNEDKLNVLEKAGGWQGWKKHLGPKSIPTPGEMEKFRAGVVNRVVQLSLAGMKAMGYDPPGSHSATGTPGWNSDIDTVYLAPKGMPQAAQTAGKMLFDLIFQGCCGAAPGHLFDTECYLDHAGSYLNTEGQVSSKEGIAGVARLEMAASSLQAMRQLGGPFSSDWDNFKKEQIEQAATSELREALVVIFSDVEAFEKDVEADINQRIAQEAGLYHSDMTTKEIALLAKEIEKANPNARYLATMAYRSQCLTVLSKMMDEVEGRIAILQKKVMNPPLRGRPEQMEMARKALTADRTELEQLQLKLGVLYLLRTSCFDEGYNTQGAFNKVCFSEGGQIHQRKVEGFQATLQEGRRTGKDVNEYIAEGRGFRLGKAQKKEASLQENLSSAWENLAMYRGHFTAKARKATVQEAAVATSKYSLRTLESNQAVLMEVQKRHPELAKDPNFALIVKENDKLLFTAGEMERVKRSFILNQTATKESLFDALSSKVSSREQGRLKKIIADLADFSEPGVMTGKMEESFTYQEKHLVLMSRLADAGLIAITGEDRNGFLTSDNPQVDAILQARVGAPPELASERVKAIHTSASKRAQESLEVETIDNFNRLLEIVTTAVYNVAVATGTAPTPTVRNAPELSMRYLWQQASV